jgi:hypothetical protein
MDSELGTICGSPLLDFREGLWLADSTNWPQGRGFGLCHVVARGLCCDSCWRNSACSMGPGLADSHSGPL